MACHWKGPMMIFAVGELAKLDSNNLLDHMLKTEIKGILRFKHNTTENA